jgi:hypothetical protein
MLAPGLQQDWAGSNVRRSARPYRRGRPHQGPGGGRPEHPLLNLHQSQLDPAAIGVYQRSDQGTNVIKHFVVK